jgi:hypothetical protein
VSHLAASTYHDTRARLGRIARPTLVLHGDHDVLTPPANARLLAERDPDATLALVPRRATRTCSSSRTSRTGCSSTGCGPLPVPPGRR